MGKRLIQSSVVTIFFCLALIFTVQTPKTEAHETKEPQKEVVTVAVKSKPLSSIPGYSEYKEPHAITSPAEVEVVAAPTPEEPEIPDKYCCGAHLDYICACVQAEALNQGDHGMRLVADCIFNRVDQERFKQRNAVEVINAKNQFEVVSNGALRKQLSNIKDETRSLVKEEALKRTDPYIIGFRTGHFGYGEPAYKYKDHYFTY